jgi:hypothetical protein
MSDPNAGITREEAADALRNISQTESHSATVYGYSKAAPHLILWGFVWLAGYGAMAAHVTWPYLWLVLSAFGSVGSFWIGYRASRARGGGSDWRPVGTFFTVFLFIAALFTVLPPHDGEQVGAFFPLFVALFYALVGIWGRAPRMVITAAALAALTLFGFFELRANFELWMAIVGGGGLILGGLWLRSV